MCINIYLNAESRQVCEDFGDTTTTENSQEDDPEMDISEIKKTRKERKKRTLEDCFSGKLNE